MTPDDTPDDTMETTTASLSALSWLISVATVVLVLCAPALVWAVWSWAL